MLHEWIHINWGAAEICPGGGESESSGFFHVVEKQES